MEQIIMHSVVEHLRRQYDNKKQILWICQEQIFSDTVSNGEATDVTNLALIGLLI